MDNNREQEQRLETPIKLGIIGVGSIGRVHLDVLSSNQQNHFNVGAISDLKEKTQSPNVDFYPNYKELLKRPDIVAVSINTPPNTHFALVMDALNAGKHVMVEKPPALSVDELQKMANLARENNKILFMAFHARYNPAIRQAKEQLKNKTIKSIQVRYAEDVLHYHDPKGWIFDPEIAGGGVLMDSGINALSIITEVMPDINFTATNVNLSKADGFKVETRVDVDFSFGENRSGNIQMDWMHKGPEQREVVFITEDGEEYKVDIVKNQLTRNGEVLKSVDGTRETVDQHSEYRGVYDDFFTHLTQNASLVSAKELEFILNIYELNKRT